jgi:alpha-beta hydrolase superfamily lysophospholipase
MALHFERTGTAEVTGKPFWLDLEPDPVFAVLHSPRAAQRPSVAVLILPPFGWDNDCSYRVRRDWATALAESGAAAARIDFPGTEDSVGSPLAPGRVQAWVDATVSATSWLRQRSGCDRLVAVGIGLGGLIAYQAVAAGAAIDDLVLWGVRASGRAYVRELRAYAAVVAEGMNDTQHALRADNAIGIGGHLMSAETAESLSAINLAEVPLPDAHLRRVLLVGRDAHGVDDKLQRHLTQSGAAVTTIDTDDYYRLMAPPEFGVTPMETISASIAWMNAPASMNLGPIRHRPGNAVPVVLETVEFEYGGVAIREHLLELQSSAGRLAGVISVPVDDARPPYGLVVINCAAMRHTGPNRMPVEITRRAAASGVAAARFDLPGLGDSDGNAVRAFERGGEQDAEALTILKEIYDHLEQLQITDRFVVSGHSLGGYLAIRAVLDDARVIGATIENPMAFNWTNKQRRLMLRVLPPLAEATKPAHDRLPPALLTIRDRFERMRHSIDKLARRYAARSELLWRLEHHAETVAVSRRLDQLGNSGARILLLFSENEKLLRMLTRPELAAKLERWPNIEVERIPTPDHLLRPIWAQEMVFDRVDSALRALREQITNEDVRSSVN